MVRHLGLLLIFGFGIVNGLIAADSVVPGVQPSSVTVDVTASVKLYEQAKEQLAEIDAQRRAAIEALDE